LNTLVKPLQVTEYSNLYVLATGEKVRQRADEVDKNYQKGPDAFVTTFDTSIWFEEILKSEDY
jgi:hypothetical protein